MSCDCALALRQVPSQLKWKSALTVLENGVPMPSPANAPVFDTGKWLYRWLIAIVPPFLCTSRLS